MITRETLVQKIAEMEAAKQQHLANANGAEGARQAYVLMLEELDKEKTETSEG